MPDTVSAWRLEQAMSLLMQSREALLLADPELAEDETELLRLLEAGEAGDALDVLRRLVRAAILAENRAEATGGMIARLQARHERYVRREENLRAAVLAALQVLDLKRVEAPDFTATRRLGPRRVIVTDETLLPAEFIRERIERSPDKIALKEVLVEGVVIDGALLANGVDVLAIKST